MMPGVIIPGIVVLRFVNFPGAGAPNLLLSRDGQIHTLFRLPELRRGL
jgi:hypothetical protein